MPTDVTETSTFASAVSAPVGGDARTAASVRTPLTTLAQRTRMLLNSLAGAMQWAGGAYTNTPGVGGLGVFLQAPRNLILGEARLNPTVDDQEVPTASLTANAWAYVYAYNNSSAFGLVASLDPPDPSRTWRGDGSTTTHRYLCTILRDGTTGIQPFERRGGLTLWRNVAASRVVLSAQSDLTATAIDCAAWAPPHARTVVLLVHLHDTGSGGTASFRRHGDTPMSTVVTVTANGDNDIEITLPCDDLQRVDYIVSGATVQVTATIAGWLE